MLNTKKLVKFNEWQVEKVWRVCSLPEIELQVIAYLISSENLTVHFKEYDCLNICTKLMAEFKLPISENRFLRNLKHIALVFKYFVTVSRSSLLSNFIQFRYKFERIII